MQEDLQEERRSTERRWAKREKTIQRVISNTSGMYGDLQGPMDGVTTLAIHGACAAT
jgi:hypothetical protein